MDVLIDVDPVYRGEISMKIWGLRNNMFDKYGDFREILLEILAVVIILSPISSVRG